MKTKKRAGLLLAADTQTQAIKAGDQIIRTTVRTEVYKRQVNFADILKAVEIVPDDFSEAPWEACDGWEHEVHNSEEYPRPGAMQGCVWGRNEQRYIVITLPPGNPWGVGVHGASKQVNAELVAANKRRTLAQLVEWYRHGWEWWGVTCNYLGAQASLWGIDDYNYAQDEVVEEVAEEVAYKLEQEGFEIINRPEESKRYGDRWTLEGFKAHLQRNLASQNWEG